MNATETGEPSLDAVLPEGWTLKKVDLKEPLIISPFGGGNDCYFNIIGDNLGQGIISIFLQTQFIHRVKNKNA